MTTLPEAQAMLAAYVQAEQQILLGKEVRLSGPGLDRSLRLEDLAEVRKGRQEWAAQVRSLQRTAGGTPTFGGAGFSVADLSAPHF